MAAKEKDAGPQALIGPIIKGIDEMETRLRKEKRLVNDILERWELPARYPDVDRDAAPSISSIRRDQFHGRPLATAAREYLAMRGASDRGGLGATGINEIYEALLQGGYKFDTKNDLNAKRGLREALSKNSPVFRRVGDAYGLTEWYPKGQRPERPKLKTKKTARKKPVRSPKKANAASPQRAPE